MGESNAGLLEDTYFYFQPDTSYLLQRHNHTLKETTNRCLKITYLYCTVLMGAEQQSSSVMNGKQKLDVESNGLFV